MKHKVEFQYMPPGWERPEDAAQDEEIHVEGGEFAPLPDVGDSVVYTYNGERRAFKVVSRNFSYLGDFCAVNIVVTDISPEEMNARLKE